jgi:hypothetical protein
MVEVEVMLLRIKRIKELGSNLMNWRPTWRQGRGHQWPVDVEGRRTPEERTVDVQGRSRSAAAASISLGGGPVPINNQRTTGFDWLDLPVVYRG